MATSLGIILILGMIGNVLFSKMKLPGLLGMLLVGMIIGPYGIELLSHETLIELGDFRKIALIVILLRAGLGLKKEQLQRVGVSAVKMSFIPGLLEGFTIAFLAMQLFGFTFPQGAVLGFIVAAVSPAVVVPRMLSFTERGLGSKRGVPTLILAGASVDDVVAITLFSAFLGIALGDVTGSITQTIVMIPVSILLGVILGVVIGFILMWSFKKYESRNTNRVIVLLSIAFLMTAFEDLLKDKIEIAALLGIMTIGFILIEKIPDVAQGLATKLNKIWIGAEILLFVLVGAQVNTSVALDSGALGLGIILIGLIARSIGVWISVAGSGFTNKEKLFAVISYTPKATVQAAIGAIPLERGLAHGEQILAIAVLAILVTAPVGAIAINYAAPRCLDED